MDTKELLELAYGHLNKAQELETKKDFEESGNEYLEASRLLFEAAKQASGDIKKVRIENAERLLKKFKILKTMKEANQKKSLETAERGTKDSKPGSFEDLGINVSHIPNISFDDVAGLDEVKSQILTKVIYPMKSPERAKAFRVSPGGGILLFGPPGTGKTHIARAIAHEVSAKFISINPATLLSKWFGEFEKNIQLLFSLARENSPSVIFFDEIESLLPKRGKTDSSVMKRAVPQFLSEMDGFSKEFENPVLIIGATNNPWDMDEAVMRPGRFDEKIYIRPPNLEARETIFLLNMKGRPVDSSVNYATLASMTENYSGADIAYLCRRVSESVFKEAIEKGIDRKINQNDFLISIKQVRPSITPEMLNRFNRFIEDSRRL